MKKILLLLVITLVFVSCDTDDATMPAPVVEEVNIQNGISAEELVKANPDRYRLCDTCVGGWMNTDEIDDIEDTDLSNIPDECSCTMDIHGTGDMDLDPECDIHGDMNDVPRMPIIVMLRGEAGYCGECLRPIGSGHTAKCGDDVGAGEEE